MDNIWHNPELEDDGREIESTYDDSEPTPDEVRRGLARMAEHRALLLAADRLTADPLTLHRFVEFCGSRMRAGSITKPSRRAATATGEVT